MIHCVYNAVNERVTWRNLGTTTIIALVTVFYRGKYKERHCYCYRCRCSRCWSRWRRPGTTPETPCCCRWSRSRGAATSVTWGTWNSTAGWSPWLLPRCRSIDESDRREERSGAGIEPGGGWGRRRDSHRVKKKKDKTTRKIIGPPETGGWPGGECAAVAERVVADLTKQVKSRAETKILKWRIDWTKEGSTRHLCEFTCRSGLGLGGAGDFFCV